MAKTAPERQPPALQRTSDGDIDLKSLADLLEWFLNFDERIARVRHTATQELFLWKQADDQANGVGTYPFENAEARFAVGVFQALAENDSEPDLKAWIGDVLNALHEARETKTDLTEAYGLDDDPDASSVVRSDKLTTVVEKRMYLTACWNETLYTAEARFLGWVYQQIYGKPFAA
jgi:hypothetical protein